MRKPLKVFFGFTQNMAVVWYRMISYVKEMNKNGAEVAHSKYSPYDTNIIQWQFDIQNPLVLKQLEMLMSTADISVMGGFRHPMGVALIQAIREKYKRPIFMEIDDYVFNLPGYNIASENYKPDGNLEWITRKQLELSDGIIVSTPTLKELYKSFNKNIYVVPNGLDIKQWGKVKVPTKKSDKVRIGFAGSQNHVGDIRLIKNALNRILKERDNVELYFWGACPEFFQDKKNIIMDEEWVPVDKFPQKLADCGFDIAIAPLKDNNFNRAKSNLRILENSILGTPVVASPLDDYKRTIKHGENGFLCNTDDEWYQTLTSLIDSVELRKKVGMNAKRFVQKNYDIADISKNYVEILKSYVGAHK
jgi:glycosyltransferase involved in cell wall biosynthesis